MVVKEVLEKAATFYGLKDFYFVPPHPTNPTMWWGIECYREAGDVRFNPLVENDDAFRLACKLKINFGEVLQCVNCDDSSSFNEVMKVARLKITCAAVVAQITS